MILPRVQPLVDELIRTQSESRFVHTLGVLHTAVVLADIAGADPAEAAVAALLHDSSKPIPPPEIEADLAARGVPLPEEDRPTPATWHGLHAAVRLLDPESCPGGIEWPDDATAGRVARAVELHSTADADMDDLGRILFTADALEPGRDFSGVDELRRTARENPEDGFRATLRHKCGYILDRGMTLHPRARRALESIDSGD